MKKIILISEIREFIKALQQKGLKVVATNGCFDILHIGHLRYLKASKQLGDFLVLGLNSDSSVRELKGPSRPINSQEDRAELLLALEPVDCVVVFDQKDASEFLRAVKPDIYTKGKDYLGADASKWPESKVAGELGIQIELIELVPDKSTTKIVHKLDHC